MIIREDLGPVRLLLMNRPPSNSLNLALLDRLADEFRQAESDRGVRCVVLGSAQEKYFSSGMDLEEIIGFSQEKRSDHFMKLIALHRQIASLTKPTVAAVEGYALLGGFILSLACDLRYISEDTGRVALSEVRLGLTPTLPLVRLVFALTGRPGLVKELVLRGKTLKAREAFDAGLVDEVLPNAGFLQSVEKAAGQLAKLPPNALGAVKRAVRAALLPGEEELWEAGAKEFQEVFSGDEAREGMQATKEKRKPRWE